VVLFIRVFLGPVKYDVGFEVLTAADMKLSIFWDITPCSSLKVNRCFGGTYRFHLQGRRIIQAGKQYEKDSKQTLNWIHGVIDQMTELLIK
jgi:hypothetical protein